MDLIEVEHKGGDRIQLSQVRAQWQDCREVYDESSDSEVWNFLTKYCAAPWSYQIKYLGLLIGIFFP
jgi:hypothetical protein